jgi:hypothetical protein
LFIHGHRFTFKHLCWHLITKILRNGPKAHFPFSRDLGPNPTRYIGPCRAWAVLFSVLRAGPCTPILQGLLRGRGLKCKKHGGRRMDFEESGLYVCIYVHGPAYVHTIWHHFSITCWSHSPVLAMHQWQEGGRPACLLRTPPPPPPRVPVHVSSQRQPDPGPSHAYMCM